MLKYLIQDLAGTVRYIPYGLVAGVLILFLIQIINKKRQRQGLTALKVLPVVCFYTYLALLIIITFLSRESGNKTGLDLQIGSTLRINVRNDAFLIENILLFIPYGFCFAWYRGRRSVLLQSFVLGFFTSLGIEIMQLITGRGLFQVDDILTNTLGAVLGVLIFKFISLFFKR
ncbi:MAG: VanZ family protein [Lachnospiraceae bacterium]|nr:VanZ family protein [Lachnospiraceae bacterium]